MIFEEDKIYHIYNMGNQHQKIFFSKGKLFVFYKKNEKIFIARIRYTCMVLNA